jgi:hypothetical protein
MSNKSRTAKKLNIKNQNQGIGVRGSEIRFLPAFAKSHGFNPWMDARRVSTESLEQADVLRQVTPNIEVPRDMPVGLH